MKAQLGMGLIGVAIAAYEHYKKQSDVSIGTTPSAPPSGGGAPPQNIPPMPRSSKSVVSEASEAGSSTQAATDAMLLVQAMVAAAAADGVIDEAERAQMLQRATDAGFDEETKRFLESELTRPASLAVIVGKTRPELATDVYAASCAAITEDTDAERVYLASLARNLKISDEATAEIRRQLGVASS